MKKALCSILCLCMAFTMLACQSSPNTPSQTDPANNPPAAVCPDDVIAVAVPVTTESLRHTDGTVIFQYMYQNMYLTIPDQSVAEAVTVDFLKRMDLSRSEAESLSNQAQAVFTPSAGWSPYIYQSTYSPTRIDRGVLSLLGTNVSVFGGPHPERSHMAANYSLVTGEVLTLGSILTHVDKKLELFDMVLEQLSKMEDEKFLYDGYVDTVRMQFLTDESHNESFYFTSTGLCFFYSPYEIAPYISGMITVEIPYADLTGILEDAYFPEERETATGDLSVEGFTQEAFEQYSQFSEVVIHPDGSRILLHTDGMIHNVRIDTGYWNLDGTMFVPNQTVFAAAAVCEFDAIMLQYEIPDALPTVRIVFDSMGKTLTYYIAEDATHGAPILLTK